MLCTISYFLHNRSPTNYLAIHPLSPAPPYRVTTAQLCNYVLKAARPLQRNEACRYRYGSEYTGKGSSKDGPHPRGECMKCHIPTPHGEEHGADGVLVCSTTSDTLEDEAGINTGWECEAECHSACLLPVAGQTLPIGYSARRWFCSYCIFVRAGARAQKAKSWWGAEGVNLPSDGVWNKYSKLH